jgi:hypothetical protein
LPDATQKSFSKVTEVNIMGSSSFEKLSKIMGNMIIMVVEGCVPGDPHHGWLAAQKQTSKHMENKMQEAQQMAKRWHIVSIQFLWSRKRHQQDIRKVKVLSRSYKIWMP